jgi:hypothetical protein
MAMPAGTTDGLTARREIVGRQRLALSAREERWVVAPNLSRAERVMRLVRVGEQEVSGEDQAEVDAYFAPDYAFHGPDGAEMDYEGLKGYFASLRAAFDDLSLGRGVMVVEGEYIACQTTITGTFVALVHPFTRRPAPPEWPRRRVRAHQHLPIRRPRTRRGGMGAEGHQMPTASVGR